LAGLACLVLGDTSARAQAAMPPAASEGNLESYIEILRSDLRTQRKALMAANMHLTDAEASRFWPIYNEFEADSTKLGDLRVKVIREYAERYETMDDKTATGLIDRSLKYEGERTDLRKKYARKMSKALSPKLAARFLQIENRIDLLLDVKLASALPLVK
jgi:hypothetical protein